MTYSPSLYCSKGHEYTDTSSRIGPGGKCRVCLVCQADRETKVLMRKSVKALQDQKDRDGLEVLEKCAGNFTNKKGGADVEST